ncbi:MAG: helix-turn-helix transcriptional regulator [Actinobacteria bacterium]|nr:helix-turn-helix transcriptional regulator [Actinomycetota bacterium]
MVELALLRREIARALFDRRRQLGLTQAAVAEMLRTSQSTVARLERGEGDVRLSSLQRLAFALGGDIRLTLDFSRPPAFR